MCAFPRGKQEDACDRQARQARETSNSIRVQMQTLKRIKDMHVYLTTSHNPPPLSPSPPPPHLPSHPPLSAHRHTCRVADLRQLHRAHI